MTSGFLSDRTSGSRGGANGGEAAGCTAPFVHAAPNLPLGHVRPDELDVVDLAGNQGDVLRLAALPIGRSS